MTGRRTDTSTGHVPTGPQRTADAPGSGRGFCPTNDLELIQSVIAIAIETGYLLCGPARRVCRRDPQRGRDYVVAVPAFEQDTVRQLLGSGHLRTGGTHPVTAAGHFGSGTSVLVPASTRAMHSRWAHLIPLSNRRAWTGQGEHSDGQEVSP